MARQIALLEAGERVVQVTMGWDEERGRTCVQRTQGVGPRLPLLPRARPAAAGAGSGLGRGDRPRSLPELPDAKIGPLRARLRAGSAGCGCAGGRPRPWRTTSRRWSVEARLLSQPGSERTAANWITGELFRLMNAAALDIEAVQVRPTPSPSCWRWSTPGRSTRTAPSGCWTSCSRAGAARPRSSRSWAWRR